MFRYAWGCRGLGGGAMFSQLLANEIDMKKGFLGNGSFKDQVVSHQHYSVHGQV